MDGLVSHAFCVRKSRASRIPPLSQALCVLAAVNINLTKEENRKLARYYRIVLSQSDFKLAYRCSLFYAEANENEDQTLVTALHCALVVSYARPFCSSGVAHVGKVRSMAEELWTIYSSEERDVHEYLLLLRNKAIAHTDASFVYPEAFVASDLPGEMVITQTNDRLAPFTNDYVARVSTVTEKAWHWAVEQAHQLQPEVSELLPRDNFVKASSDGENGA